jgi:hypothetical protein
MTKTLLGTHHLVCVHGADETVGFAVTRVPTLGSKTELKAPCGARARKCTFIY